MKVDKLLSPKLKVERANRHIVEATAQIITFLNTNGNLIEPLIERDPDGQHTIIKARFLKAPPADIGSTVGDALSNLRAALDHLVRCLAVENSGDPERAEFPFAGNWKWFSEPGTQRKLEPLSDDARKMICDLQPYRASDEYPGKGGNDVLWALNRLRNSDVHKLISPLGMITTSHELNIRFRPGIGVQTVSAPKWVRFDENMTAEFMRMTGLPSDIEGQLQAMADIGFGDIEPVAGYPVVGVLHNFSNHVRSILTTFEERFFR